MAGLRGEEATGVCAISAELLRAGGGDVCVILGLQGFLTAIWQSGKFPCYCKGLGNRKGTQYCNIFNITLLGVLG